MQVIAWKELHPKCRIRLHVKQNVNLQAITHSNFRYTKHEWNHDANILSDSEQKSAFVTDY